MSGGRGALLIFMSCKIPSLVHLYVGARAENETRPQISRAPIFAILCAGNECVIVQKVFFNKAKVMGI